MSKLNEIFGKKIKITKKLYRLKRGYVNTWIEKDIPEIEVIIIGKRTLSDCEWEWDDCFIMQNFNPTNALLVVKNMKEKPFYIKKTSGMDYLINNVIKQNE